jgi:hypothetical protein
MVQFRADSRKLIHVQLGEPQGSKIKMALQLFIGQPKLNGALGKYASRYNLLELRADQEHLPRENVLRRWADEVPERFAFSILLTPQLLKSEGDPNSGLNRALPAAQALRAKWLILQTEPMWGPSQKVKLRLAAVLRKLLDTGTHVGWEPHGVWQDEEAHGFAREVGVHFVRDIGRGDPMGEDVVYSRMPSLGIAARMSIGTMERVARNLGTASEAYIVVAGEDARKLQQLLPDLVSNQQQRVGGYSMVETFGGFSSAALPSAEDFAEFDPDESDTESDEEGELELDDGQAQYDSELDDEEDEEDEGEEEVDEEDEGEEEVDEGELPDAVDEGQPASKLGHNQKKRTKGRNRR